MSLYILVEGDRTEKALYQSWVQHCFPSMRQVERVEDLVGDSYFIISGKGYPNYKTRILNSLKDIQANKNVRWFLICVDSEEMTYQEKHSELTGLVESGPAFDGTRMVIQHCCIETWLLAHSKVCKRNPEGEALRGYLAHYDVRSEDPENMPAMKGFRTRASFHVAYLRAVFQERNIVYSKQKPGHACDQSYLLELVQRGKSTNHIRSFWEFVAVLKELGAADDLLGLTV